MPTTAKLAPLPSQAAMAGPRDFTHAITDSPHMFALQDTAPVPVPHHRSLQYPGTAYAAHAGAVPATQLPGTMQFGAGYQPVASPTAGFIPRQQYADMPYQQPVGTSPGTINLGQVSMPYNMETYGYGTSAGTINLGQVSMPYNMETYGYQQPHVAPYQQPPVAPYQQPSVLPVPVPVTQHVMAPTLHQFRFYEENVTVFGGQQHMYEPAPWVDGAKKAFTVWHAERQKQEKEWQARMVKEYLGYHPELQEKLEIEYGLPGQIPGQIPGQLPGQFPGQIPGQFPSAASLPGGNPSLAET